MASARPFHVFISYASEDRNGVAAPLAAALRSEKLNVWFDTDELRAGDEVHGRVEDGLRDSSFVVAVITPDYLRKDWPRRELAAAAGGVIPVLHGITREELQAKAPLIARLKTLDWGDGRNATEAIVARVRETPRGARSDVAVVLAHNQADWDDLEAAIDERLPEVTKLTRGFFDDVALLDASRVLIMPLPHKYTLTRSEVDRIEKWVQGGGGLFLMGHYAERHHETNASAVAWRFNLEFGDDVVMPASETDRAHARSVNPAYTVVATPSPAGHALAAGVRETAWISAASVRSTVVDAPEFTLASGSETVVMRPLGRIEPTGYRPEFARQVADRRGPEAVLAARTWKRGRVVVAGTWKIWTVPTHDNAQLLTNVLTWLRGEEAVHREGTRSAASAPPRVA